MITMQPKIGDTSYLTREGYIFELKLDGIRAFCKKKDKQITFINRRGRDITQNFPELTIELAIHAEQALLDGEIVVYGKAKKPDFHLLLRREQATGKEIVKSLSESIPATYVAFDVLERNNKNFRNLSLLQRKQLLRQTITEDKHLQVMYYTKQGIKLWQEISKLQLEGVIAKKDDSVYFPGRTSAWLKIKKIKTVDCIILGYTTEKRPITSLALGLFKEKKLQFIGKVGTGFSEAIIRDLLLLFHSKRIEKSILPLPPEVIPLEPSLVCEVEYLKVTEDEKLRSPIFRRLRQDKVPEECAFEQISY